MLRFMQIITTSCFVLFGIALGLTIEMRYNDATIMRDQIMLAAWRAAGIE